MFLVFSFFSTQARGSDLKAREAVCTERSPAPRALSALPASHHPRSPCHRCPLRRLTHLQAAANTQPVSRVLHRR